MIFRTCKHLFIKERLLSTTTEKANAIKKKKKMKQEPLISTKQPDNRISHGLLGVKPKRPRLT